MWVFVYITCIGKCSVYITCIGKRRCLLQAHLEKVCLKVLHPCPNRCDPTLQLKLPEVSKHSCWTILDHVHVHVCISVALKLRVVSSSVFHIQLLL